MQLNIDFIFAAFKRFYNYKDNETIEKGLLEIPAGKIREYENIYAALRREVFEEIGIKIKNIKV